MGVRYSQINQKKTINKPPKGCRKEPKGVYWGMGSLEGFPWGPL